MHFDARAVQEFRFNDFSFDEKSSRAFFRYSFDDTWSFEEQLEFRGRTGKLGLEEEKALEKALRYLHLMLGVSYYKAAVPEKIVVSGEALSERAANFFSKTYEKGLAEFAHINGIALENKIKFPFSKSAGGKASDLILPRKSVVPLGGGKDSLVSLELVRTREPQCETMSLGEFPVIEELVEIIGAPHMRVIRRIDPLLLELNKQGAYNGHVPFSAMLACLMPVCAILYGYDCIVMSQERSANVGSLINGKEVNHQYSKSLEFETDFSELCREEILANLSYFSLLRPLSELQIARRFSELKKYHSTFSSCNRAFRISSADSPRWCNDCPKCRFVYLSLAPFLSPEELHGIFGKNLLDDPTQSSGYRELLGLEGHKPFECVGEIEEARLALALISRSPAWKQSLIVSMARPLLSSEASDLSLLEIINEREAVFIPVHLRDALHAAF